MHYSRFVVWFLPKKIKVEWEYDQTRKVMMIRIIREPHLGVFLDNRGSTQIFSGFNPENLGVKKISLIRPRESHQQPRDSLGYPKTLRVNPETPFITPRQRKKQTNTTQFWPKNAQQTIRKTTTKQKIHTTTTTTTTNKKQINIKYLTHYITSNIYLIQLCLPIFVSGNFTSANKIMCTVSANYRKNKHIFYRINKK